MKYLLHLTILLLPMILLQCSKKGKQPVHPLYDTLYTNTHAEGIELNIHFTKGMHHNYPLMVIWIEDTSGNYLQTLYVAESIGKGIFNYGQTKEGKWMPGEIRRPAALPYWSHKRGIKAEDGLYIPSTKNPMPDAISGETPLASFILKTKLSKPHPKRFNLLFEINQTWDWNEYWTNNKYPDDDEYKTSCQPALVYATQIDLSSNQLEYLLKPIGHSHYSGKDGKLYSDLTTLTTALEIASEIRVLLP